MVEKKKQGELEIEAWAYQRRNGRWVPNATIYKMGRTVQAVPFGQTSEPTFDSEAEAEQYALRTAIERIDGGIVRLE